MRIRKLFEDQRGVTLVELMIAMILFAAVGAFTTAAVVGSHQMVRATDDETQGLQDVRVAAERLVRDIRDARSVVCNPTGTDPALVAADPNCVYHLQLWIDYNSNYVQDPGETVTWKLRPVTAADGTPTGHYDLVRTVGGMEQIEAHTIVQQVAFSYDVQPGSTQPAPSAAHTTTVKVDMTYDPLLNNGTGAKTTTFSGRLRNAR